MPLIKELAEAAMTAELEDHLANEEPPNRKNGKPSKIIKSPSGSFELNTSRDRAGTFEPQLLKKHQTHPTDNLGCRKNLKHGGSVASKKSNSRSGWTPFIATIRENGRSISNAIYTILVLNIIGRKVLREQPLLDNGDAHQRLSALTDLYSVYKERAELTPAPFHNQSPMKSRLRVPLL